MLAQLNAITSPRGPETHGSKSHREPGSIGPMISGGGGKVYKVKNSPGQMGGYRVTVQRLSVVKVDAERNLYWLKVASQALKVAWLWFATQLNLLNNHLSKEDYVMPTVATHNQSGVKVGEIQLNDAVFGVEVNEAVMHQAVVRNCLMNVSAQ